MSFRKNAVDVLLEALKIAAYSAASFLWWLAIFAILSLILMNVLITSWEQILTLTKIFGTITAIAVAIHTVRVDVFHKKF